MKYYNVLYSNDYASKKGKFGLIESIPDIDNIYLVSYNEPFPNDEIDKLKFVLDEKAFADLQMCIFPWCVVSKKLKEVLEKYNTKNLHFYPIILHKNETSKVYFIMHFDKTVGFDKPEFTKNKALLIDKHVEAFDDSITSCFFISETVKNQIELDNLTGIYFDEL